MKYNGKETNVVKLTYSISPAKVSDLKVSANKRGFRASWKRSKYVSGYQLQYSTTRSFKWGDITTKTINGKRMTSRTIRNLRPKKAYYVRVRSFKRSDDGTFTSKWSAARKVTTRR